MFDTLAFSDGPAGKRVWTTCLGMTAEAVLVATAVVIPIAFPTALPKLLTPVVWIGPPAVAPRVEPAAVSRPAPARLSATQMSGRVVYQPGSFPAKAQIIEDAPGDFAPPAAAGLAASGEWINGGILLQDIFDSAARIALVPPVIQLPAAARVAPPQRVVLGSEVKEAVLLHRVEPVYPALARQTRVSGKVELEGVIGTDGRIRELAVKNGNPLLVPAAKDAVRQWIYKPTLLNGAPVEVALAIVVTFRLN
jgi:protein TonB